MEIKDYNFIIDWRNFFGRTLKNYLRTYDNIQKISTGQDDDYTTACLPDYPFFKKKLWANCNRFKYKTKTRCSKAIQLINFTSNLNRVAGATMFFILEAVQEVVLDFSKGTVKVLCIYFVLIRY